MKENLSIWQKLFPSFSPKQEINFNFRKKSLQKWIGGPKVPYFFFPAKVHFHHTLGKNRLDEWKSCFFFRRRKKKTALRSNEWMANELSMGKKIQKKHTKTRKTKKYNPILYKKSETLQKIEWMPYELFFGEKKRLYFFSRFA